MPEPEELVTVEHPDTKGQTTLRRDAYEMFLKPAGWRIASRSDQPKDTTPPTAGDNRDQHVQAAEDRR